MIVIFCVILGLVHALKVLVAGDQHSTFHESVAIQVARGGPHSVFKTSMLVGPNYKAKSKEEPLLRTSAGAKFKVMRLPGIR